MANDMKNPSAAMTKDDIATMVREAVSSAVAVGMAMQTAKPAAPTGAAPNDVLFGQCASCRQRLTACKGKHRDTVVFPKNPRYADPKRGGWVGVQLNNVSYRSNNPSHKIPVPSDFYPENIVAQWEAMEDIMAQGRVGGAHIADLSPAHSNMNPNTGSFTGWKY